jgi:hypothetical protein
MKLKIKLIIAVSLVSIFLVVLSACSSSQAATSITSEAVNGPPKATSVFKVTNLSLNPAEVNAGVQLLIAAKVTNTGVADDVYQTNLRIDNTAKPALPSFLPSDKVKIAHGTTQLLSVTTTINNPGTYKVTWGEVSQTLVVNPGETAASSNSQNAAPATAPDFSAVDVVTGKPVSLKQYKGSAILLNFVNYGCNPSTNQIVGAQLLTIKQLQTQRNDFVPVSVFCGCCFPDVLRQFATDNNLNWPWILDNDYSIASKYASSLNKFGYPTLIFIDKDQFITNIAGSTDLSTLNNKISAITPAATQ